MQDDTREHVRVPETVLPGKRVALSPEQSLLLPPAGTKAAQTHLIIHFHGPSWLVEVAARKNFPRAAVLSVQARGTASDSYRELLAPSAEKFPQMLEQAALAAGVPSFRTVTLTSFSAGYGAVREILRERSNWARIDAVLLADSMHASYGQEQKDLGAFVDFARETAASSGVGKRFLITHSEVFPGTYASSTEAASYLLRELGLKRKPVLEWGTLGMQQVSRTVQGGLAVLGFAGNSAPDHLDHFFALEDWLRRLYPVPPGPAGRKKR